MSKKRGTNVLNQLTVPPMPKERRYIDESILIEKLHVGEGLPTISRSVLVNCVLPTIPTADVRENVRGEWIEITNETEEWYWHPSKCSVCGAEMLLSFDNFCPNCGADMRGDRICFLKKQER